MPTDGLRPAVTSARFTAAPYTVKAVISVKGDVKKTLAWCEATYTRNRMAQE